jgi:uncharacterized membrane protein
MELETLIPAFAVLIALAVAIAVKAIVDTQHMRAQLTALSARVHTIDERVMRLDPGLAGAPSEAVTALAPVAEPEPASTAPPEAVAPREEPAFAPAPTARPPTTISPVAVAANFERMLVENWLVWVGGIALALGGAFFVKLSIDHNLLTPSVRIVLGVLLGLAMSGTAEWLARRDPPSEGETAPSYVPQALAAAGAVTVFATLYAAHRLYALLPPPAAFALLAVTAAATLATSLRHGPFVAALGVVGAFAVPLLVESDQPGALSLFAYLTVVSTASLVVLRYRAWWWLAWIWLGGVLFWVLAWLADTDGREPALVGAFLLIQLALFAALRRGVPRIALLAGVSETPMVRVVARTAFWLIAAAMFVLVHADGFAAPSLTCTLLTVIFLLWVAYRDSGLDDAIAVAGALPLALLASWSLPMPTPGIDPVLRTVPPVQVVDFVTAAVVSGLLLGGLFLLLPRVARQGRWAALSAAAPLAILAIAYWRLDSFGLDIAWSSGALALAALELGAAAWVARRRTGAIEWEIALASYAVGVLGGTILAATLALSNAWLTVALALHLPALGWVEGRIRLPILRRLALGVAAVVLVRLALNPSILTYPLSETPIFNWLLYGYGVPALAFIIATRQFGSRADDLLVRVLEAGAILFTTLLLTLELRHLLYARIDAPLEILALDSSQTLLWLGLSALLLRLGESRSRLVLQWGGVILFGLATLQAVLWQAIIANPLWTGDPVGRWIGPDALTVAYGLPAVLYAGIAYLHAGPPVLGRIARGLAAGFGFFWLTLEVRHGFRGEVLLWGTVGETEWYAYSMAWLLFAAGALALGLISHDPWLRRLALAGIALVVAKVFLSDMAELSGALRALSFLALGAALVGMGYAYKRLRPLQDEPEEAALPQ